MSTILLRSKLRAAAAAASSAVHRGCLDHPGSSLFSPSPCRPALLRQVRRWTDGAGDGGSAAHLSRRIRTEANCPRCSKHMEVLFSSQPPSPPAPEAASAARDDLRGGGYQAINLCPSCRSAFYFRPNRILPLQGSFVEIGKVRVEDKSGGDGKAEDEEVGSQTGNQIRTSFWDLLRAMYGGNPPENWPSMPGLAVPPSSPGGNELAVHSPPAPPSQTHPEVVRVKRSGRGGRGAGSADGGAENRKEAWGGSNLGKDFPTPKQICKGIDKFVIGQEHAKKVSL